MQQFKTIRVFTSMPFGKPEEVDSHWQRLFEAIKGVEDVAREDALYGKLGGALNIDRADIGLETLGLRDNVKYKLDRSDVLVAVIVSNQQCPEPLPAACSGLSPLFNANVMWEIGYAEAKRLPVVYLVDERLDIRKLPIMITNGSIACYFDLHNFSGELDESTFKVNKTRLAKRFWPHVNGAIRDIDNLKRFPVMAERFEVTAFSNREAAQMRTLIEAARRSVDIITTNLEYFAGLLDRPQDAPQNWMSPFHKALAAGAKIRLVTMNPDSQIAELRANQLDRKGDVHEYRNLLRKSIMRFYNEFREDYGKIIIHIYEDLPLQITCIVDGETITSYVTRGSRSRDQIHVKFQPEHVGVATTFIAHFESVFNTSNDLLSFAWVHRPPRGE